MKEPFEVTALKKHWWRHVHFWDMLCKQLAKLNDNNFTARKIYDKTYKLGRLPKF